MGGSTGPKTTVAYAQVSVPWVELGPPGLVTSVGYRAPACAQLFGVGTGGNVHTGVFGVNATLVVPFDRSGCGATKRFTTTVTVFPVDAGPGAPSPPSRVVLQTRSDSGVDTAVPRGSDRRVTDHTQHGGGVPDAANTSRRYRVPWRSLGSRWSAS